MLSLHKPAFSLMCLLFPFLVLSLSFVLSLSESARADITQALGSYSGESVEWLTSAPDGTISFAIRNAGKVTVYKGGAQAGTFDAAFNPLFSLNSKSFAFLSVSGSEAFFVVNGNRMSKLNSATGLANPQFLAFSMAQAVGFNFNGTVFANRDTVPQPPAPPGPPGFFTAPLSAMYVNGKAEGSHGEVGAPVFNPVKNELAYRVRDVANPPAAQPMKLS
jgi:hypothetical protein